MAAESRCKSCRCTITAFQEFLARSVDRSAGTGAACWRCYCTKTVWCVAIDIIGTAAVFPLLFHVTRTNISACSKCCGCYCSCRGASYRLRGACGNTILTSVRSSCDTLYPVIIPSFCNTLAGTGRWGGRWGGQWGGPWGGRWSFSRDRALLWFTILPFY